MTEPHLYRFPDRREVEEWAERQPDNFLECRSWRHKDRPQSRRDVMYEGSEQIYTEVFFYCESCGRTGVKIYNADTGMPVYSSSPRYPHGYLSTVGRITGPALGVVRLETIARMPEAEDE